MPATLTQIREGLRARLSTIDGLHAYAVMPPKPEPPAAAVLPIGWDYGRTFDGAVEWRFEVWIYVNPADLQSAQQRFDQYMEPASESAGPLSVAQAIEADVSLGGLAVNAVVLGAVEYARLVEVAGSQLLGGALRLTVLAS